MQMRDLLVGSTGFVGNNLQKQHGFFMQVHSVDVDKAYGLKPELCVYSGIPAAMFLANENPVADLEVMKDARENLRRIKPRKTILISTVATYSDCDGKNESYESDKKLLSAYGKNRLQLEEWVMEDHGNVQIIRLPAIYAMGLKKNFLYDLHYVVPQMIIAEKFNEIKSECRLIRESYQLSSNGYYILKDHCNKKELKNYFLKSEFNALSFTDSRSRYQFYNLSRLWNDIGIVTEIGKPLVNLVTPPITTFDIYEAVTGKNDWKNEMDKKPYNYDLRTQYDKVFGFSKGYICEYETEIKNICEFMREWNLNEA